MTIASATPGFLRICWPTLVLNLKTLLVVSRACALAFALASYGEDEALLRLVDLSLPIVVVEVVVLKNIRLWVLGDRNFFFLTSS